MKRKILLALWLLMAVASQAQSLKEVENAETLTWYGIDFTQARFQNFGAYMNDATVKKNLPLWTMTPFGGDDLSRFKKKYSKKELLIENKQAATRNTGVNYDNHLSSDPHELDTEKIKAIVAEYDIQGNGYGLLFIVESFQNIGKKGSIWYAYINKADKSIIAAEKVTTETFGDWFESVNNTIKRSSRY